MMFIHDQSFLKAFDHIYALTSDKRNIENYALRIGVYYFLLKKVKIPHSTDDRQSLIARVCFQNYLCDELVSYYLRKKKKKSAVGLIQIQFECKKNTDPQYTDIKGLGPIQIKCMQSMYEMNYFIIRRWIYGQSLKSIIRSEEQELFQLTNKQLVKLLLNLFTSTMDFNHSIISTSNVFVQKVQFQQSYRFGLHYTSVSDYLFLVNQKIIDFYQFKEIYPYLHQNIFKTEYGVQMTFKQKVKSRLSFKLKIHSFAVILLQILFKKELSLKLIQMSKSDLIGSTEANHYLASISDKYKNILKLQRVKDSISKASKELQINILSQFLQTILTINNEQQIKKFNKFSKWSQIIKVFNNQFFENQKIILKIYPKDQLKKMWQKEPQQTKDCYQRWGIIIDTNIQQIEEDDYILYALYKFQLVERPIIVNNIDQIQALPKFYQPFPPKKIVNENQADEQTIRQYLQSCNNLSINKLDNNYILCSGKAHQIEMKQFHEGLW